MRKGKKAAATVIMKDKEKEEEEIFQIPCEGKTDVLR
jgi:hypothetical protein